MQTVDMIASGYGWICPNCERLNNEIEILEEVTCVECGKVYKVGEAEHAYGKGGSYGKFVLETSRHKKHRARGAVRMPRLSWTSYDRCDIS